MLINSKHLQLSDSKTKKNELIKVIAIIAMLIDHIGAILFPDVEILRILGRIAFPIFAFQIAQGYIYTSNYKKYMFRIYLFAVFSQIPYMLAFDTLRLNILFTFCISLFLINRFAKKEYYWIFSFIALPFIIPIDYMWYGVFLPVAFYLFRNHKVWALISGSLLTVAHTFYTGNTITLYAIVGVVIALYLPKTKLNLKMNKYFFYWFYPVHLTILFIIYMVWF